MDAAPGYRASPSYAPTRDEPAARSYPLDAQLQNLKTTRTGTEDIIPKSTALPSHASRAGHTVVPTDCSTTLTLARNVHLPERLAIYEEAIGKLESVKALGHAYERGSDLGEVKPVKSLLGDGGGVPCVKVLDIVNAKARAGTISAPAPTTGLVLGT